MKKNKLINLALTLIMILNTIFTPQLAYSVSAELNDDEIEETEKSNTPDMDVLSEDLEGEDSADGDSAEIVEVGGESQTSEDEDSQPPYDAADISQGEAEEYNNNDPPTEEVGTSETIETKDTDEDDNTVETENVEEDHDDNETSETEQASLNIMPQRALTDDEIIFKSIRFTDADNDVFSADNPYDLEGSEIGHLHIDWALPDNHSVSAGDTYTFNLPDEFRPIEGTNGTLGDVGTWTVDADGTVVFTFNDNVYDDVTGNFWFEIKLVEEKLEETVQQEVKFPIGRDPHVIRFEVEPKGGSLIDKDGTIDNNGFNSTSANWTVDINTGLKTLINTVVTDEIPDNMTFREGSVNIRELAVNIFGERTEGEIISRDKYSVEVDTNGDPIITFNDLSGEEARQAYRITYTTDIVEPDSGFDGTQTFTNRATLTSDGKSSNASGTVSSGYGRAIEKNAPNYTTADQIFDWTIDYNFNQKYIDVGEATIVDNWTPAGAMELVEFNVYTVEIASDGEATVSTTPLESSDYTLNVNNDNSGFELNFNNAIDGTAYQIQYQTRLLGEQGTGIVDAGGIVNNTVTTGTGMSDGSSGKYYQQGIIKNHTGTDVNAKTIKWEVLLNRNSYRMDNLELTDQFSGDGLTLLEDTVTIKGSQGNFEEGQDYTLEYTEPTVGNPGSFTITFKETIDEPLTLNYTTHFERNSDGSATYGNQAGITWSEGDNDYSSDARTWEVTPKGHTAPNGVKTGTYNATNKQITWEVNTNYARLPIENPYTIVDTIPENQVYVADSFEIYSYNVDSNGVIIDRTSLDAEDYDVTYPTDENNAITVTLAETYEGDRTAIGIRFNTEFVNDWVRDELVVNTAVVTNGDDTFKLDASVEIPFGGQYASKTGTQAGSFNERVDWTIALNPNQTRISNYTLSDYPDLNSVLMEDTFVVYEANVDSNGNVTATDQALSEGTDYNLVVHTDNATGQQNFVLQFLNEIDQAYVLNYSSYIDPMTPQNTPIENRFKVEGQNIETIESPEQTISVTKANAGGGDGLSVRGGLTVSKADEMGNTLAGAQFELYTRDGSQLLRSGTTDEDGELDFGGLRRGQYLLRETRAPEGYVISDELAEGIIVELTHEENDAFEVFNFTNARTKVEIRKENVNGLLINERAVFNIYDSSNVLVRQNVPTTNGTAVVEDLDPGDYYLVEQEAPEGYILSTARIPFRVAINEDGTQTIPTVVVTNYQGTAEFRKTDAQGNPLAGAEFRVETTNGATVRENVESGDNGVVRIDNLAPGTYYLRETRAPNNYIQNLETVRFVIPDSVAGQPEVFRFGNFENYQGAVQLIKTNESGQPLSGATYEIRNVDGETVGDPLETDEDGRLIVTGLAPGQYTFVEISAPEGYVMDRTPVPFEIKVSAVGEPERTTVGDVVNYQGSVVLRKTNANEEALAGATFNLYEVIENDERVLIDSYTSNRDGLIEVENLAPGNYVFVETEAPDGYLINENEIIFTIDAAADGRPTEVEAGTLTNYKGSVVLNKVSSEGEPLEDAVFEIRDLEGTVVQSNLRSDENGQVTAGGLAPGDYVFVEMEAPEGYLMNETQVPFTIENSANGVPEAVDAGQAVNYQGSVEWQKVNEAGEGLGDASFSILDETNRPVVENLTSDAEGNFFFDGLTPGNYTIIETKASEGYLLNTKLVEFTIPESAQDALTVELDDVINYKGSAQMFKVNEDNDILPGATFEVRTVDGGLIDTLVSDVNGRVLAEGLAPGDYAFIETASPDGYITNTEPVEFTIPEEAAGEPKVVVADNFTNYQGTVVLEKTNEAGEPLEGAVFEIRDLDGNLIQGNLVSNKAGLVEAENLAPGTYEFHEVNAPNGYLLNEEPIEFTIEAEAYGRPLQVEAGKAVNYQGSVMLEKVAAEGNALENAVFEIRDLEGATVQTNLISDEQGLVTAEDLAPGDYILVEIKAPEGYILNETEMPFTIESSAFGEPAAINVGRMVNYQGSVEWRKVNEAGEGLAEAKFNILDEDGNTVVENVSSNEAGLVEVGNLAPGVYNIEETATVDGYILNTEQATFEIESTAFGAPTTVTAPNFVNYQGKVRLTKTDTNGNPLEGAVFNLELDDEVVEEELTTDAAGQIIVDDLAPGEYTFRELRAPEGYIIDTALKTFTIEAEHEGEPVMIEIGDVVNYQGSVLLKKVDIDGKPLEGAVFELRDAEGNLLRNELMSNEAGLVEVTDLAPGQYVLTESKAPSGYILNTSPITFTIEEGNEGQPEALSLGEFVNYQGSGAVIKTDEEGNVLANAEFSIFDSDGNEVRASLTSNEDGRINIDNLAPGQYILVETKAPEGYVLSDERYTFEIAAEAEGEPTEFLLTVTNALEPIEGEELSESSEDETDSEDEDEEDTDLPGTGETQAYTLLALALITTGLGLSYYRRKRWS